MPHHSALRTRRAPGTPMMMKDNDDLSSAREARDATIAALIAEQVRIMVERGHPIRDREAFCADWRARIIAQARERPGFLRAAAERLGLPHVRAMRAAEYAAAAERRRQEARARGLRFCGGLGRCDAWTPVGAGDVCGWCGRSYPEEDA